MSDEAETRVLLRLGEGSEAMEVREDGRTRWLSYVGGAVQSRMDLAAPERLVLPYTRAMMAALLFVEAPATITLLGLGGGSLARYLHHAFPRAHLTVVERDAAVIHAARELFYVPGPAQGCTLIAGDAREHLAALAPADLVAVDLFEAAGPPAWVGGAAFCRRLRDSLHADGVLSMNLWTRDDDEHLDVLAGLREAFAPHVLVVLVGGYRNLIALAFARRPRPRDFATLYQRAAALEKRTGLALAAFVTAMREANPHDERGLLF
ncbi:MAG: fused MFS/spermidine synthase [Gammaproteobacteria bacterium]|nr:fused MFS/spermidine synthase [Gammaproteobacteria bacterium]